MGDSSKRRTLATSIGIAGVVGHGLLLLAVVPFTFLYWRDKLVAAGRSFMEAGWMSWGILGGTLLSLVLLLVLAVWFGRSSKSWSWTPAIVATPALVLGVVGLMLAQRSIAGALASIGNSSAMARIQAMGLSEALNITMLMGIFGALTAAAASTLPAARALQRVDKGRAGWQTWVAVALGLLGIVAVGALDLTLQHVGSSPHASLISPSGLVVAFTGVVSVAIATTATLAHREGENDPSGALGDAILVALLATFGVALAAQAQRAQAISAGLGAMASNHGSLPFKTSVFTLAEGVENGRWGMLFSILLAVPVWVALLPILATRLALLGRGLMRVGGGIAVTTVVAVFAAFGPSLQVTHGVEQVVSSYAVSPPSRFRFVDIDRLPEGASAMVRPQGWMTPGKVSAGARSLASKLTTSKDCLRAAQDIHVPSPALRRLRGASLHDSEGYVIAVSADVPFGQVACVLSRGKTSPGGKTIPTTGVGNSPRGRGTLGLLTANSAPSPLSQEATLDVVFAVHAPGAKKGLELPAVLKPLMNMPKGIKVTFQPRPTLLSSQAHLHLQGPKLELTEPGQSTSKTIARVENINADSWPREHGKTSLLVTASAATPMSFVLKTLTRMPREIDVTLAGKALVQAKPEPTTDNTAGTTTDSQNARGPSGSLPPEVIRRIIRRQQPRIKACYEKGLRRDPQLNGKLVVRFVIGPTGAVSSVRPKSSTLSDQQVTTCVLQVFGRMSFPQPEGGAVTVTYPIVFRGNH